MSPRKLRNTNLVPWRWPRFCGGNTSHIQDARVNLRRAPSQSSFIPGDFRYNIFK